MSDAKKNEAAPAGTPSEEGPIEQDLEKIEKRHSKSRFWEVVRFIVVAILCMLIDFAFEMLTTYLLSENLALLGQGADGSTGWGGYVAYIASLAVGFLMSSVAAYYLSAIWVFRNTDGSVDYRKAKYFWIFTGLAFGGLLIGIGIAELGAVICNYGFNMNITADAVTAETFAHLSEAQGMNFWAYLIIFCVKTVAVGFYDYFTRKKILFKEPKKEEGMTAENGSKEPSEEIKEAAPSEEGAIALVAPAPSAATEPISQEEAAAGKPVDEAQPGFATATYSVGADKDRAQVKSIDTNVVYCKPQFNWGKPLTRESARNIVYSALEQYDRREKPVVTVNKAKEMIVEEIREASKKEARR
jgi:putative flippase GtrA